MPENEPVSSEKIVGNVAKIAGVVGQYGVAAIVFALPTVIGCFGVYFLGIAMKDPQVSLAKAGVGIFATVFGSGMSILLIFLFTNMKLWDSLGLSKISKEGQKALSELQARVTALEKTHTEQIRKMTA